MNGRARGFTLIEILVAVTIFAIFIGAVYGTYAATQAAMSRTEEHEEVYQAGRVLLAQLAAELTSAWQPATATASTLTGEDTAGRTDDVQADVLTFRTTAHRLHADGPVGDITDVSYTLGDADTGAERGLYLTETLHPDLDASTETPEARLLSARVVSFNCRYLPPDGSDWVEAWTDRATLPQAVRLELVLQPEHPQAKPVALMTTVNLMTATAPAAEGATDAMP